MSFKAFINERQFVKRGAYHKARPVIFQNLKINILIFPDQLQLIYVGIIWVWRRWDQSLAIFLVPVVSLLVLQISFLFKGPVEGNRFIATAGIDCSAIVDNKPIIL